MSLPISVIPAKRRVHRKRRGVASTTSPPGSNDHVVSVVIEGTNLVIVTVAADVVGIGNAADAMWVRPVGEPFVTPVSWELLEPRRVQLIYEDDISACTLWMVGEPGTWQWADGEATVAPFEGSMA
jgi:hypothetical protein